MDATTEIPADTWILCWRISFSQMSLYKYYINTGSFWHHNNCGSTHPLMAASEENKLPPSYSGFKSKKFLHESSYGLVSGTDDDEQSLKKT